MGHDVLWPACHTAGKGFCLCCLYGLSTERWDSDLLMGTSLGYYCEHSDVWGFTGHMFEDISSLTRHFSKKMVVDIMCAEIYWQNTFTIAFASQCRLHQSMSSYEKLDEEGYLPSWSHPRSMSVSPLRSIALQTSNILLTRHKVV